MTRIALLRGINVGGHRKVSMADLRKALVDVGFDSVETYIQSGNVVFRGGPADDERTEALIANVMSDRFDLDEVGVIVLTPDRLQRAQLVSGQAFPADDSDDGDHATRVHVVFLAAAPDPARRASLHPDEFAPDRFILDIHEGAAELHVEYAVGAGKSKLTNDRIERGLGVRATARNLNTIDRLMTLASD